MITLEAFIDTHSRSLLRSAWLLTGNWASAEDLVQTALLRSWLRWDSITTQTPEVYVRQVLMNTYLSSRRRRWNDERPSGRLPERAAADAYQTSDLRQSLNAALAELPARQRAMVVLRYFNDLSEADTARTLGCSVGNVKSQTSRALAKLRAAQTLQFLLEGIDHG
jgi:RNA polymerase sigma-70 factor (sigma-E family)